MERKPKAQEGRRKPSHLETLKIYLAFKDFRKYMYVAIDKMPRWIKVSEGMECIRSIKQCIRFLSVVARSYDKRTKLAYIDRFLTEWDVIYDSISFFYEVKGITSHQRDVMATLRQSLEEQVSVFRWWLDTNQDTQDQNPKDQGPRSESSFRVSGEPDSH